MVKNLLNWTKLNFSSIQFQVWILARIYEKIALFDYQIDQTSSYLHSNIYSWLCHCIGKNIIGLAKKLKVSNYHLMLTVAGSMDKS